MLQVAFYREAERDCRNLVLVIDGLGFIQWVNTTFRETTGYAPEEVVGARIENILRGPDTESYSIYRLHRAIQRGESIQGLVITYYRKDGCPVGVKLDLAPAPGRAPDTDVLPDQYVVVETPLEEPSWFDSTILRKLKRAVSGEGESGQMDYTDPTETQLL